MWETAAQRNQTTRRPVRLTDISDRSPALGPVLTQEPPGAATEPFLVRVNASFRP